MYYYYKTKSDFLLSKRYIIIITIKKTKYLIALVVASQIRQDASGASHNVDISGCKHLHQAL